MSSPDFTEAPAAPVAQAPIVPAGPPTDGGYALATTHDAGWVAPSNSGRYQGKRRSPFGVWVLTIVTFGIYGIVWHYKVNRELRDFHPSIQVNPGLAVLALFFPIAGWCTVYNTGKRIAQAQQLAGMGNGGCSGALGVLLCFVFGLHPLYYQSELNRVWR